MVIQHMKRSLYLAIILLACLGLVNSALVVHAAPAQQAAPPPSATTVSLLPVNGPGFVRLVAYVLRTELACEDGGCAVRVRQSYRLHNRDRAQEAHLRLTLPVSGQALAQAPALTDARGTAIVPASQTDSGDPIWELTLGRNEQRELVLSYTHALDALPFVRWAADLPALAPWGGVDGARIEFGLPHYLPENAFMHVEPSNYLPEAASLMWEYEQPPDLPPIQVWMYAPATWDRLSTLQATNAHHELAGLYAELAQAAGQEGLPWPDPFDQIVAELQAAIQADPNQTAARMDLAKAYRQRADQQPDLRLNYLILSAQELAHLLELEPNNAELAEQLSQSYYEAATLASQAHDPAGALLYLKKASEVPGTQMDEIARTKEDLTLRWAVELADQGQVQEALELLADMVPPQVTDTIVRYAPPFTAIHTEVTLTPTDRVARYDLTLYAPVAERTLARLQALADQLAATDGVSASLQLAEEHATLEVRVPYATVAHLQQQAAALRQALAPNADFLSTNLAAAWEATPDLYALEQELWYDRYSYQEQAGANSLQAAWDDQSQYIGWRTVELRTTETASEREQLEQRLALLALQEQRAVWEQLPTGSYTVYQVEYVDGPFAPQDLRWLVPWGHTRNLQFAHTVYHWNIILPVTGGAVLLVLVLLFLLAHRRRRAN
jgi:hypothetical protein